MAESTKQDSNFTELRFARETSPGVLPVTPTWIPLEPNDYSDFGGEYTTKARMPINPSRQRKKGVIVDLDASGGYTSDITPQNVQDIAETFVFADLRKKSELAVASVDGGANAYEPDAGGEGYVAGDLLFAKGFTNNANNGLKVASGTPDADNVPVTDTGLVDEENAIGIVSRVGKQFAASALNVDASGDLPVIVNTSVAASRVLTASDQPEDAETVTIGGKVYTFQTALTNVDGHVKIGGSLAASLANLKNAINRNNVGVAGTDFAAATTAHPSVTAVSDGTTVTVTAIVSGTVGNAITTVASYADASWPSGTLTGGTGVSLLSLGLISGEPIYIGGDEPAERFLTDDNNGFARVRSVTNNALTLDKSQFSMANETGTGLTIRIFFGRVLKNEVQQSLIVQRSIQLERTLGAPDDAQPGQIQAEYITRCLGDELTLDAKTADIFTADYKFLGGTHETRVGATGPKPGNRPAIVESDAFNTTSDVSYIKLAVVQDDDSAPDPLFAYLTDYKVSIKNNIKQNKAISVLGAFSVTAGTFEVSVDLTAYFNRVESIQAVRDNANVTLEAHHVKDNVGFSFDMPLLALSKARADVKLNEPVMLPMTADAATGALISPLLDYTIMFVFWDYLPDAAE